MKKLRGKKRYYKKLSNEEIPAWIQFDNPENNWFDFFHHHIFSIDNNNKWKSRKQHLDALFTLAEKYELQLSKMTRDFQYWININEKDSYDDSIYIHTKNPNESEFPIKARNNPDLKSNNENLLKYLECKNYKIVRFLVYDEEKRESINYYLYKEGLGIQLE